MGYGFQGQGHFAASDARSSGIHERNCCSTFAIDRTGDFVPTETRNQLITRFSPTTLTATKPSNLLQAHSSVESRTRLQAHSSLEKTAA
jgi:hypothetical protein